MAIVDRLRIYTVAVLIILLILVTGVSAKSLTVFSAQGNQGVELFISCNESDQLNGAVLNLTWNP
jgi:hypothetical protein